MTAAISALAADGQPDEIAWPYESVQRYEPQWGPPQIGSPIYKAQAQAGQLGFFEVCAELDKGKAVVLGLVITQAFYTPDENGIVRSTATDIPRGGHAVLAVGYGLDTTSRYLLIRNSWGPSWGTGGYGWISEAYVAKQLHETAIIV